ncbi:MAG: three-Cys-motif partner protein TcmP [Archaeoglobaceae archaeon]
MKNPFPIENLDKRIKILLLHSYPGLLEELAKVGTEYNDFKSWTPLKLVSLSYFVGPYLRITGKSLKEKYGPTALFYLDLFAGSGVNRVIQDERKYYLAGSPIVVIDCATKCDCKFDKIFFVEKDEKYAASLKKRLEYLENYEYKDPSKLFPEAIFSWISGRYEVICEDSNKAIDLIVDKIESERYKNFLAFIDPFKWELKMKTLEKLLEIEYGDIFITFQAILTAKEIGKENLTTESKKEISDFLGLSEEEWRKLGSEEAVKNYYIGRIKEFRQTVEEITIRSGKGYKYYLIFATRQKDPRWINIIKNLKNFIESFSGDIVEQSLKWLYGDMVRLTDFID